MKIAGFFEARADMAVGDAKMLLLNWMKCAQESAEAMMEPEARLVTRDDFYREPAYDGVLPCWKESRSRTRRCGWVAIVYGKALQDMELGVARYWTGVPTEEQRREMAWPEI
jgi:hypothetical protein